jgi:putative MATE family efflux protein
MQVKATYSEVWKIAYPIILATLAQTIVNVTDSAFLARVGEVEMGAASIGGVFYFLLIMLGLAVSIGSQILISRKAGEGNKHEISVIFNHSFILLSAFGILLFLVAYFLAPSIYNVILLSEDIANSSSVFIKYRSFGLLFSLPVLALRAFYIGISDTKIITYQGIILAVVNICLGYILIFGHLGFEPMGVKGAAIASASAEIVSALFIIIYTFYSIKVKEFYLFRIKSFVVEECRKIISISSPILFQNLISMGSWFLFFVMIEKIGEHELAVSNVIRSSYTIMMTTVWGFSSAANSMVSNLIGQKKQSEIFKLIKKIVLLSISINGILVLIYMIFPSLLLNLVASDKAIIKDSMASFYIVCIATLILSISIILLSAVSGTGKTRAAMRIEIVNILLYLGYIYVFTIIYKSSVEIVWLSEIIYWFSMGIFSFIYLKSKKWVEN